METVTSVCNGVRTYTYTGLNFSSSTPRLFVQLKNHDTSKMHTHNPDSFAHLAKLFTRSLFHVTPVYRTEYKHHTARSVYARTAHTCLTQHMTVLSCAFYSLSNKKGHIS